MNKISIETNYNSCLMLNSFYYDTIWHYDYFQYCIKGGNDKDLFILSSISYRLFKI